MQSTAHQLQMIVFPVSYLMDPHGTENPGIVGETQVNINHKVTLPDTENIDYRREFHELYSLWGRKESHTSERRSL